MIKVILNMLLLLEPDVVVTACQEQLHSYDSNALQCLESLQRMMQYFKKSIQRQFCFRKRLVDEGGQRRTEDDNCKNNSSL